MLQRREDVDGGPAADLGSTEGGVGVIRISSQARAISVPPLIA
jgi:hypothetical protein